MKIFFIRTLFLFLISLNFPLFAEKSTLLEFRTDAFYHASHRFRKIYGRVGPSFQFQGLTPLNCTFDGFANIDYFTQNGRSTLFKDRTRVNIANFSLGVLYRYEISDRWSAYGGIGGSISTIAIKNYYGGGGSRSSLRGVFGGVLKSGFYFLIDCDFVLDVYVDYLYQPVHYQTYVDIGGAKVGAGIGYKF